MGKALASHISRNGLYKLLFESYYFRSRASIFVFVISSQQKFVMEIWPVYRAASKCNNSQYLTPVMLMCILPIDQKETVVSNVNILSSLSL